MKHRSGYSRPTYYFYSEGRDNLDKTIQLVCKRVKLMKHIKKVLVFTSDGEGAFKIRELLDDNIQIIAATFPYKMPFYITDEDGTKKEVFPGTSHRENRQALIDRDIHLIQGVMALQDIPVPGSLTSDTKVKTINSTLSIISGGLKLCIEAILMASDSGYVEQGEEVISFSADTAVVATGCRKDRLFHPEEGLEIREIICKPRKLSILHMPKQKR